MTLMTLNFDGDYMHRTAPTVLVSCIVYDAVCLSVLATFMSSPPAHIPGPISLLCVQYNVVIYSCTRELWALPTDIVPDLVSRLGN